MRRGLLLAVVLVLGVSGGALLGGCGSATKTVSVSGPPATLQPTSTAAPAPGTSTTSTTTTTAPAQTTTSGGAPAPGATRTAPEPAFTQHGSSTGSSTEAEGLSAATAVVRAKGFTPNNTSDYHPDQALRVLVGTRTGVGQQAFFFVNGRYIGTDSTEPSATLRVVGQNDTEVTLAYPLYRAGAPTGGQALVHFQLNNGKLVPLNPIPPASSANGLSRQ